MREVRSDGSTEENIRPVPSIIWPRGWQGGGYGPPCQPPMSTRLAFRVSLT